MIGSMAKTLAEEFEEEFISRLSAEDRRAMVSKMVDDALREGRATPSQFRQLAQKQMTERLARVAAEDFAAGTFDEQLSEIFYKAMGEVLKTPLVRERMAENLKVVFSRVLGGFE